MKTIIRYTRVLGAFFTVAAFALALDTNAAFAAGGCPAINAFGNFQPSALVGASTSDDGAGTVTYTFSSLVDESPTNGVPGLISYCVYPSNPQLNPDSATAADVSAYTGDGSTFHVNFGSAQGFFSFTRDDGNPSNILLNGTQNITMGTATWNSLTAPKGQDILLHINDTAECTRLYGNEGSSIETCFVRPNGTPPPPFISCPGDAVACKSVIIDEAITVVPLTVPAFTKLHIHYTYVINNTTGENMLFYVPGKKTQDINAGGGKDYFGCEQQPDSTTSTPGTFGTYYNYQGTGLKLTFTPSSGACDQSRFTLTNNGPNVYVLPPGESITFTIDMVTRKNKGNKQEYTSCGQHLLNSGFTVKWFQTSDYPLLHSFSTNITPLYVDVIGCKP